MIVSLAIISGLLEETRSPSYRKDVTLFAPIVPSPPGLSTFIHIAIVRARRDHRLTSTAGRYSSSREVRRVGMDDLRRSSLQCNKNQRVNITNTRALQRRKKAQMVMRWTVVRYKYLVCDNKRTVVSGRKQCVGLWVIKCVRISKRSKKSNNRRRYEK